MASKAAMERVSELVELLEAHKDTSSDGKRIV